MSTAHVTAERGASGATLVDRDTQVDVSTGMIAAGRLQALIESRASGTSVVQLIAQLDRIIRAIHDSVPEELWDEILRKIDGPVPADVPRDDTEDCEDAEGSASPFNTVFEFAE
jgi:hypothetical protein